MDDLLPMECGMNIADLPLDVLRLIFDEFRDPEVLSHGEVDWSPSQSRAWRPADSTNLQTIQNARLACRLFNSVASPLLAPVLRLDLSRKSLQIANGLTQNP
uniref:F-box domain-containing protein n=1 Tax=Bionectria ochroleuca TaxID=29856 RepID=A0A8H7KBP7_BIOOC